MPVRLVQVVAGAEETSPVEEEVRPVVVEGPSYPRGTYHPVTGTGWGTRSLVTGSPVSLPLGQDPEPETFDLGIPFPSPTPSFPREVRDREDVQTESGPGESRSNGGRPSEGNRRLG